MSRDANTPDPTPNPGRNGWRSFTWPVIVVVLLGGHVFIITGALLLSSTWIPGASTAPSGYAEALRWDDLKALRVASDRLGWSLEVVPTDRTELNGDRHVEFLLRNAQGEPLEGAELAITLYHHSRPHEPITRELKASTERPGHYESALRIHHEGVWRLEATAHRAGDHFLAEADLWIGPPEAS